MKIYIVREDYTNAMCGIYNNEHEAREELGYINGWIDVYEINLETKEIEFVTALDS